jgi:HTH-type transcriptional regulator / antitoxin HipB
MSLQDIGETVRAARRAQKRSQAELADALGMSRATISAIENGTVVEIGVRKVIALCNALGLDLSVSRHSHRPTLQELREERRAARSGR